MNKNPFNGDTFQKTWLKHFANNAKPFEFNSIENTKFYKKGNKTFVNIGKNITNGNFYKINESEVDYKGKTFLIYDVPDYFNITNATSSKLKVKKVKQYKGFSSQLQEFETFDDFFNAQFKSKSRYKYRRNISRLETCFDIEYKIFCGDIPREEYERICVFFKKNLSRRFGSLGLDNNIVSKWDYYYDLIYKMILSKEGVLTAIYSNGKPIGISFGFLTDSIMLFAITSFDIDYLRYNLGHTTIIKLMNWCFDNGFNVYDFSKGQYEYKDRWTNHSYNYECHILYDSSSLASVFKATYYEKYFKLKQYLRDKNVNRLYTQLKYKIKPKAFDEVKKYTIEKLDKLPENLESFNVINIEDEKHVDARYNLYQYLYLNPEKVKELKVFQADNNTYFVIGEKNKLVMSLV